MTQLGTDLCPSCEEGRQLLLLLQEGNGQCGVVIERRGHDIDQQVLCAPLIDLWKLLPYPLQPTRTTQLTECLDSSPWLQLQS